MAKTSKKQIYEDERKILAELQGNARGNIDDIAKKCGFSRQKIWRIMKRLEKNKTIWGYTTIIDDEKLERKKFIILIKRSVGSANESIKKIMNLTMQKKGLQIGINIEHSYYLHGNYDWLFVLAAENLRIVNKFSNILITEYSNIISDIEVMECMFPIQQSTIANPNISKFKDLF